MTANQPPDENSSGDQQTEGPGQSNQQSGTPHHGGQGAQQQSGQNPPQQGKQSPAQQQSGQSPSGQGGQSNRSQGGANQRHSQQTEGNEKHGTAYSKGDEGVVVTTPTVKPVLVRLAITVGIGLAAIAIIFLNPQLLGSVEVTNIGLVIVQILVVIAVIRLVVKLVILWNTEYVLTPRAVRREYELLARAKSREVPYDLVRSHERNQGRIEHVLGVGSIALNQGLGDLTLESLRDHEDIYQLVRSRVDM